MLGKGLVSGLVDNNISLPSPQPLLNKISYLPYYFIGHEVFGLKPYLLTPRAIKHPQKWLQSGKKN